MTAAAFAMHALAMSILALSGCSAATSPPHLAAPRPHAAAVPPVHLAQCTGPATSLPDSLAHLLPPRVERMYGDMQWAELARTVPGGFAGIFYDSTHTPILMLTQPARAAEARDSLMRRMPGLPFGSATVREARWDFAQLVDWYNYLLPRITVANVTSDKDESIDRIRLSVTSIAARDSLVSALSAFTLPCDLVVVDLNGFVREW